MSAAIGWVEAPPGLEDSVVATILAEPALEAPTTPSLTIGEGSGLAMLPPPPAGVGSDAEWGAASPGMTGLETALSVVAKTMVETGLLSWRQVADATWVGQT